MKTLAVTFAGLALAGVTGANAQTPYPYPYGAPPYLASPGVAPALAAPYGLSWLRGREPLYWKMVHVPTGRVALVLDAIKPAERLV
jgi:hypothetical protein